jgi:putative transposase
MCERAFRDFGLPKSIRTDNGTPFSVWWLSFGIGLERIQPAGPRRTAGTRACT